MDKVFKYTGKPAVSADVGKPFGLRLISVVMCANNYHKFIVLTVGHIFEIS